MRYYVGALFSSLLCRALFCRGAVSWSVYLSVCLMFVIVCVFSSECLCRYPYAFVCLCSYVFICMYVCWRLSVYLCLACYEPSSRVPLKRQIVKSTVVFFVISSVSVSHRLQPEFVFGNSSVELPHQHQQRLPLQRRLNISHVSAAGRRRVFGWCPSSGDGVILVTEQSIRWFMARSFSSTELPRQTTIQPASVALDDAVPQNQNY